MSDTRCRYCLALAKACEANRLYGSRACCPECAHGSDRREGLVA